MMKSEEEIEEERNRCLELREEQQGRPKWPGMTYEQGVEAALDWVMGDQEEAPISEA